MDQPAYGHNDRRTVANRFGMCRVVDNNLAPDLHVGRDSRENVNKRWNYMLESVLSVITQG